MAVVASTFLYFFGCFLWLQVIQVSSNDQDKPINFPPTIPIKIGDFDNWANDLEVPNIWIATPSNENDVLSLTIWALENQFLLRASGFQHTWSPFTVTLDTDPGKEVLVDTTVNLNNIQPPTKISTSKYAVTAQTGVSMEQLLTFLESYGLGLYAVPAPGDLTLGGVLAIGGHGTGVPYFGEIIPPGHALGTISNLVVSFKAVVWDAASGRFVLKTFQRSDVEAKAFITEVTLMVGSNYNLRCQSRTDITKDELFSQVPGPNAFSTFLDKTGRIETITFPFTDTPWLKVWTIKPTQPLLSRHVTAPFNYPFSDTIPESVALIVGNITKGAWDLSPLLGTTQLAAVKAGLTATLSADIWGPSKNLLLYVKPTTLRVTANGYAVITQRANVQKVVSSFNNYFYDLVDWYKGQSKYPFNGPMEIRATSLDKYGVVTNGEPPSFSAIHPINGHSEYDTVIWLDILSIPNSPYLNEAMHLLETFVTTEYDGTYASVRPEWSKGWAYTDQSAWSNEDFYRNFVPLSFTNTTDFDSWNYAVKTLDKYDPYQVFTNSFIDSLLQVV